MTAGRGWTTYWHRHPGVRSGDQLTVGERAADRMRNVMGSWPFVFAFFAVMGAWAVANSVFYLGGSDHRHGFDPYPYILLNLFLSMLAGVQAAALLIAAKRADAIASEIALHTEQNTDDLKALLNENTELTRAIKANTDLLSELRKQLSIVAADPAKPDGLHRNPQPPTAG
jgi:uncharacterized membrane protein